MVALALILTLATLPDSHVRSTTPEIRALIAEGRERSEAIRSRLAALEDSNLIVYVDYYHSPVTRVAGFVTFAGTNGGWRYIRVSLRWDLPRHVQLVMLGHELQHAVEIAAAPAVVDPASMARFYAGIGSEQASGGCRSFDTRAAVEVERQIRTELNTLHPVHDIVAEASPRSGIQ